MTKLEQAARQVLQHWASSEDLVGAITALREALAEPQITTPDVCGEVCVRAKLCYGCGKALDEANAKYAEQAEIPEWVDVDDYEEQAEQEPVGNNDWKRVSYIRETLNAEQADQEPVAIIEKEAGFETEVYATGYADSLPDGVFKLYAAPVQQAEQEPVVEALRLSEEAIEYARQGGKIGSGIYGKALAAIRLAKEQQNDSIEETKTTDYMLGFSDGKNYAHKYEQAEQEPVGYLYDYRQSGEVFSGVFTDDFEMVEFNYGYNIRPLYAAPVRTKDLTVSELDAIIEKHYDDEMDLKAMILDGIAADREKNRG